MKFKHQLIKKKICFENLVFEFRICFEFRASGFGFFLIIIRL